MLHQLTSNCRLKISPCLSFCSNGSTGSRNGLVLQPCLLTVVKEGCLKKGKGAWPGDPHRLL